MFGRGPRRTARDLGQALGEPAELTAEDASVVSEVTERHLLPRFDLFGVAALARYAGQRRGRITRAGVAARDAGGRARP